MSSSVLQFDYAGRHMNLLDTPGHNDFSEDTYRTLSAADTAIMLIDCVKGVEPQTIKLFQVCRMRGIPIVTFVNKMDRPGKEPSNCSTKSSACSEFRAARPTGPWDRGRPFRAV